MSDLESLKAGDYAWSVNYGRVRVFNNTMSLYPNAKGVGEVCVQFGESYIQYTCDGRRINWDDNGNVILDACRSLFLNEDCYISLVVSDDVGQLVDVYNQLRNGIQHFEQQYSPLVESRATLYINKLCKLFYQRVKDNEANQKLLSLWPSRGFLNITEYTSANFRGNGVVFEDQPGGYDYVYTVETKKLGSDIEMYLHEDVNELELQYEQWYKNYEACKIKEIERLRERLARLENE